MITLQKIALKDLESFFYSDFFKELKHKPISEARMRSYVNNPRAKLNDYVLFMAFDKKAIVGYRTILPDSFINGVEINRFGWLSGSWVHPKHRRKGVSTLLFNEVIKEWNSKLMYSNYAQAAKLLFDKTNQFQLLSTLEGVRFYRRFSLGEILSKKHVFFNKTKRIWKILDTILNTVFDFRSIFSDSKKNEFTVKQNESLNDEITTFIKDNDDSNLFNRAKLEFNWIQNFPWLLSNEAAKIESHQYYFSLYSKEFYSNIYTIYNTDKTLFAVLFMVIRDGNMKIPYAFFKENDKEIVGDFIKEKAKYFKVDTITIYHKNIEMQLAKKMTFIYRKKFVQKFFSTKCLFKAIDNKVKIYLQSGDGDSVFT